MSGQDEYRNHPVRHYVITGGRARPSRNTLRPETLLVVADAGKQLPVSASTEERALLDMCHRLLSLVEAAVHLDLPVSVVSVVASDMIDTGYLKVRGNNGESPPGSAPAAGESAATRPDRKLLQEVLDGLRKLA
jgi:hypothetical protein